MHSENLDIAPIILKQIVLSLGYLITLNHFPLSKVLHTFPTEYPPPHNSLLSTLSQSICTAVTKRKEIRIFQDILHVMLWLPCSTISPFQTLMTHKITIPPYYHLPPNGSLPSIYYSIQVLSINTTLDSFSNQDTILQLFIKVGFCILFLFLY